MVLPMLRRGALHSSWVNVERTGEEGRELPTLQDFFSDGELLYDRSVPNLLRPVASMVGVGGILSLCLGPGLMLWL